MQPNPQINQQYIEAVINCPDPVLRNLLITQTYCEINTALSDLLGRENVSWCAYAAWASKTAGKFIRKDSLEDTVAEFLRDKEWISSLLEAIPGAMTWFGWKVRINEGFLGAVLNETAREAAAEVAAGNLMVFAELAPLYEKFLRSVSDLQQMDQSVLEAFLGNLQAPEQEKLVQAYTQYYQAIFEQDAKSRAERIFLANLLVGYHEQIRLDPAINGSIRAPVDQLVRKRLLGSLEQWVEASMPGWLYSLFSLYLKFRIGPLVDRLATQWSAFITERWMRIEVPDGSLDLSEDIPPAPDHTNSMFPEVLASLELPDLKQILEELDLSPDSTTGSAARDWGRLSDRMNFIADFFRSAQQDQRLFRLPFSPAQIEAMKNNRMPEGKL